MFDDNWTGHLLTHLIAFLIFTLPVSYLIIVVVLGQTFNLLAIAAGAALMVFLLGLMDYGIPGRKR